MPASAAGAGSFYDITDEATANAAEVLRLLGVVNGTGGGAFRPAGTLTRAEFCKMTIEIMGLGGEEPPSATAPFSRMWAPPTGPAAM